MLIRTYQITCRIRALATLATMLLLVVLVSACSPDRQFSDNQTEYEAVVELVRQGDIQVPSYKYDLVPLPAGYEQLSANGSILVDGRGAVTRVLFYTQSTLFTYEGYLYVSDDQTPTHDFTDRAWLEVRRVAPYWFFVSGKGD